MKRGLVAAVLLAILTILGGLDFLEDTGLIHYSTSEMDRSVEDVLYNYGEAIRSAATDLSGSHNPSLQFFGQAWLSSRDFLSMNIAHPLKRKRNLDFSASAFDPLAYNQILIV